MSHAQQSYVYFLLNQVTGLVKIGISVDISSRLKELEIINACSLEFLGYENGGYKRERQLHRKFSKYNTNGEWFTYSKEIADYIKAAAYTNMPEPVYTQIDSKPPIGFNSWDDVLDFVNSNPKERIWRIGDIADSVKKRYAHRTAPLLADLLGVSVSAIKQYRRVARFYPSELRYFNLPYSFYRAAMCCKNLQMAVSLLSSYDAQDITVSRFLLEVNRTSGREMKAELICRGNVITLTKSKNKTHLIISVDNDDFADFIVGKSVKIVY